jgi:hypothetical protein
MKRKLFVIGGILLACIVFLGALYAASRLVAPKYHDDLVEGHLTGEYYDEKTDHDVLFVGDCEVFENFSPVTLYNEYGITSYIRGGAQQLVWHSYYLLEDALKTETPRVVVFNVLALKYGAPQSEAYNRLNLDGMRWGAAKLGAIKASMTEGEDLMSYVFPLLRYHDRITGLTREDVRYWFSKGEPVSFKGYLMHAGVKPNRGLPTPPILKDGEKHLPESSMEWLGRMAALCKERGIALVLIKSPSIDPYWYPEWSADVEAFAKSHGLLYTDMIERNDAIGIDMQTDTYDEGAHLNVFGAEKAARWLGERLQREYALPDHRGEAEYDTDYAALTARYEAEKQRQISEENGK